MQRLSMGLKFHSSRDLEAQVSVGVGNTLHDICVALSKSLTLKVLQLGPSSYLASLGYCSKASAGSGGYLSCSSSIYTWHLTQLMREITRDGGLSIISLDVSFAIHCVILTGLWCHGVTCSESTCDVDELLDSATTASVGTGAFCAWKDGTTALVTFGRGGSNKVGDLR